MSIYVCSQNKKEEEKDKVKSVTCSSWAILSLWMLLDVPARRSVLLSHLTKNIFLLPVLHNLNCLKSHVFTFIDLDGLVLGFVVFFFYFTLYIWFISSSLYA